MDKLSEVRKAYYPLIIRIIGLSFIVDLLMIFSLYFILTSEMIIDYRIIWTAVVFMVKVLIMSIITTKLAYEWTSKHYYINGDNLIKLEGIYYPNKTAYNLHDLFSVKIYQNILGKLLNYGCLSIKFRISSSKSKKIKIHHIVDPDEYQKYFEKYVYNRG